MWTIFLFIFLIVINTLVFNYFIKKHNVSSNKASYCLHHIDEKNYPKANNATDNTHFEVKNHAIDSTELTTEECKQKSDKTQTTDTPPIPQKSDNKNTDFIYNYTIKDISHISYSHSNISIELIAGIEFEATAYELYKRLGGIFNWDVTKKDLFYETSNLYAPKATPEGFSVYFIKKTLSKDFSNQKNDVIVEIRNCDGIPDYRDTSPMLIFTELQNGGFMFAGMFQLFQAKRTGRFYTKVYMQISNKYPLKNDKQKQIPKSPTNTQSQNSETNLIKNERYEKKVMKSGEFIYAKTHADFLNQLLGRHYKAFMQSGIKLQDGKWLWMIRLGNFIAPSGFKNYFETPERIIEEYVGPKDHPFERQGTYVDVILNNKPKYSTERVVFDIVELSSTRKYIFRGVFCLNKEECTLEKNIWDCIDEEYQF